VAERVRRGYEGAVWLRKYGMDNKRGVLDGAAWLRGFDVAKRVQRR
jgi:hypothetical protein